MMEWGSWWCCETQRELEMAVLGTLLMLGEVSWEGAVVSRCTQDLKLSVLEIYWLSQEMGWRDRF